LLLPYLSGERSPVGDSKVRGVMMGIAHETDRKALTHGVLDGLAFAFRDNLDALREGGANISRLMAVGGGTKSEIWLKIIATALNVQIDLPASGDIGGAFGAARMGMVAATGDNFRNIFTKPKIAKTIKPEKAALASYEDQYQRYKKIYPAIREI